MASASTRRRRLPLVLIGIGTLLAFLAIFALWANRQLLDTDNWTDTSSQLLEDDDIRSQMSIFLVDQLYANVDVEERFAEAFPRASSLAGPIAGGVKDFAIKGVDALLERPRPQELWEETNRRAHKRFLQVVEGGGDNISTEGGEVTLDLKSLLDQTADRVGVGGKAADKIPADAAQIVILKSDQLELAQDAVRLLKAAAIVLIALGLGLIALAIYLAKGWRREALRASGFGLLLAGVAALVARSVAGGAVVDSLATTESIRPAAESAWSISTSLLVEAASASIAYGIVLILAAWLAGPTSWAIALRRNLAPYLREPRIAYSVLALIILLLVWWGPTPALRKAIPALILIALLVLGFEVLRRQAEREFPNASRAESAARMKERAARVGQVFTGGGRKAEEDRYEQLERLGRLRDSGVIDAPEFEREKAQILGGSST
jgi:hypothetical protein